VHDTFEKLVEYTTFCPVSGKGYPDWAIKALGSKYFVVFLNADSV